MGGAQAAHAAPTALSGPASPSEVGAGGGAGSVTLLTGDRVFPGSRGSAGYLRPGPGREAMRFSTFETEGHSYVVPEDAEPLLAKGVLDKRLFDVTELIDSGYGD
ncbi:MAG TPA: hypothetical protein VNO31_18425, partial [Umezawaea sp.]|nr:hypothetical protein [Umezawaea sp.]